MTTRQDIAASRAERRKARRLAKADPVPPATEPPPLPWSVEWVGGFAYVRDATGRRIASLLGPQRQRELVAEIICALDGIGP